MRAGLFTVLFLILFPLLDAIGQCSMCKAVVETSAQTGNDVGGINDGIVYMMAIPYILIATVGYLIYRNYKKFNSGIES